MKATTGIYVRTSAFTKTYWFRNTKTLEDARALFARAFKNHNVRNAKIYASDCNSFYTT